MTDDEDRSTFNSAAIADFVRGTATAKLRWYLRALHSCCANDFGERCRSYEAGTGELRATVDTSGAPLDISILRTSGLARADEVAFESLLLSLRMLQEYYPAGACELSITAEFGPFSMNTRDDKLSAIAPYVRNELRPHIEPILKLVMQRMFDEDSDPRYVALAVDDIGAVRRMGIVDHQPENKITELLFEAFHRALLPTPPVLIDGELITVFDVSLAGIHPLNLTHVLFRDEQALPGWRERERARQQLNGLH